MPTPGLDATLKEVRRRLATAGSKGLNEQNTKATLIEPVLRALGWDTENVDEVAREYKRRKNHKPVDYGLLALRTPRLFVEAKALDKDLDDHRWTSQIMGYASVAGVEWIVLTNGDEYRIYNSHARVPVEEKMLRSVRVSEDSPLVHETLELLAKPRLEENRLEVLWRAHFVDRQVQGVLEGLFGGDNDILVVNHIQQQTRDLSPEEIRSSLQRCRHTFDFPVSPRDIFASGEKAPPQNKRRRSGAKAGASPAASGVTVKDLIEGGQIKPPLRLFRRCKQHDLTATVLRDGRVEFDGTPFDSPSKAAVQATASVAERKGDKPPATNGWAFWRYDAGGGKERPLGELRDDLAASAKADRRRNRNAG